MPVEIPVNEIQHAVGADLIPRQEGTNHFADILPLKLEIRGLRR